MNSFESGQRKLIPAVLIYLRVGREYLLIHRDQSTADFHHGFWNGLGGKLEAGESSVEAAIREVREESGLNLTESDLSPLGILHFPNFKPHRQEDWHCTIFMVELLQKPAVRNSSEGTLHWQKESDILNLPLWPGDHLFLPKVFAREPFVGTIWYHDRKVTRHDIRTMGAVFKN